MMYLQRSFVIDRSENWLGIHRLGGGGREHLQILCMLGLVALCHDSFNNPQLVSLLIQKANDDF